MPLDTSIYDRLQPNMASQLAGSLNQFTEQRARLSDLAQQREQQAVTQGYQNRALQRAEDAIPAQQAEAQRQQAIKHKQELNLGVSTMLRQGATPEQVLQWGAQESQARGIDPQLTQNHLTQVFSSGKSTEDLANAFEEAAYPQEVAKQRFEQRFAAQKQQTPTALSNIYSERAKIEAANPNDPRLVMYDQLIEKTVTTPPAMQIVTSEGGGMQAVTLPKRPGQRATVQSLGINAVPKVVAPPKKDVMRDALESNALLDQAEKAGPLATGSGAGSARDYLGSLVGVSTEGAKSAAQMKVIGASLTAKVPKMTGPQSDKDVAMYKEAAGNMANEKLPWETRLAAVATIREINNRQLGYAKEGTSPEKQTVSTSQTYEGDKEARYQAWKAKQGAR